jgi:hypothetical protein
MAFRNSSAASEMTATPAIRIMVLDREVFGIMLYSDRDTRYKALRLDFT